MKEGSALSVLTTPLCFIILAAIGILSGLLAYIYIGLYLNAAGNTALANKDLEAAKNQSDVLAKLRDQLTLEKKRLDNLTMGVTRELFGWVMENNQLAYGHTAQQNEIQTLKYQLANDTNNNLWIEIPAIASGVFTLLGSAYDIYLYYAISQIQTNILSLTAELRTMMAERDLLLTDYGDSQKKLGEKAAVKMGLKLWDCTIKKDIIYHSSGAVFDKAKFREEAYKAQGPTLIEIVVGENKFGGMLKEKWPAATEKTSIIDQQATTFSMKAGQACYVSYSHTENAVSLKRDDTMFSFGDNEIIVYTNGSVRAANGQEYYCYNSAQDKFYADDPFIPKVTDFILYKVYMDAQGDCPKK